MKTNETTRTERCLVAAATWEGIAAVETDEVEAVRARRCACALRCEAETGVYHCLCHGVAGAECPNHARTVAEGGEV